jgi:hypothetical protein
MCQQLARSGMLLLRADTEPPGDFSTRCASLELCGEQVSDLVYVPVRRV